MQEVEEDNKNEAQIEDPTVFAESNVLKVTKEHTVGRPQP